MNRFQSINSASLWSRYDNPIPTRCLAPIDFLKIPALAVFFFWDRKGISAGMAEAKAPDMKGRTVEALYVRVRYLEYQIVCPFVWIGSPSPASEFAPPPPWERGGGGGGPCSMYTDVHVSRKNKETLIFHIVKTGK
jgi:hypothetical protein